ncbi:MAG: GNAT family N-acetyltransferase [Negativibacillus massiliensis]|uniref:GNAT family N-acetyltransferase n=1 Tax=Negativibacillus massiliensis TaxID=1871035 RepID=UPI00399B3A99|nr:GNAT family N-acetyltransferase [Clostridium sp.]
MIVLSRAQYEIYRKMLNIPADTKEWSLLDCCFDSTLNQAEFVVDRLDGPKSAAIILGDFVFLFGEKNRTFLTELLSERQTSILMAEEEYLQLAQEIFPKTKRYFRYKMSFQGSLTQLTQWTKSFPQGYCLEAIDEKWFEECKKQEWMKDFCSQFSSYRDYQQYGLGFLLTKEGRALSGASSYLISRKGLAIQVQTAPEEEGKGYATLVSAALIVKALEEGKYPDWDADNETSAHLAQKLGYCLEERYPTVMIENEMI